MKFLVLFFSLVIANLSIAGDHEGGTHTRNYCTVEKTCAHLMFPKLPKTTEESEFLVHVMPSNEGAVIENLSIKLWMDMGNGHGHGSSPVTINPTDEANHYEISDAWFVMTGEWQVIVTFKEDGVDRSITIPILITE